MDQPLRPAQIAKLFGISIKTLRLYEQHGLLVPLRHANGRSGAAWRTYGPDQVARLHQILALKRLDLSLGRIGELLSGQNSFDQILAIQEQVLTKNRERISHALTLIRQARAKLASGDLISIEDLATVTRETHMTKPSTAEELKEILAPFQRKHLTPQEEESLTKVKDWASSQPDDVRKSMEQMKELLGEAKRLMESEDAASTAAIEFAKRFRETGRHLKNNAPSPLIDVKPKLKAMMDDARSNPAVADKLGVFAFIEKALANLKAQEERGASNQ